jgi:exosortase D (VPLPA-CTERM-specific)
MSRGRTRSLSKTFIIIAVLLLTVAVFSSALRELIARWYRQDEYSHGFLIPIVAAWMLWMRRDALRASVGHPSWCGPLVILLAALMLLVGELSAFYLLSQLGFVTALLGIVLMIGGFSLLRSTFVPIAFLIFAIPLPYFIDSELSWRLQLLSSQLGVFFIRLFGVPVHLTGNVIDLGIYKLQVAEACSGLRYLYPLLSFGFLAAYLFQAPWWQRTTVFLSAIPITIVMNSFRIGMVGVLVDRWGIEQAEGMLHFFEGWIIFIASTAILAAEMWLLARIFSGKALLAVFHLPKVNVPSSSVPRTFRTGNLFPVLISLLVICCAGISVYSLSGRKEIVPDRQHFVSFPRTLGAWQGQPSLLEPQIEHVLGLDDYILTDYTNAKGGTVNFYVAYYASQRSGSSPHSPMVCIPGGGWQIVRFERSHYQSQSIQTAIPLNRVLIGRDKDRLLVYYWFVQRGRNIANEYWSKWQLFVDAVTKNRTDGALVRLVTPVGQGESEASADRRLQSFLEDLEPRLRAYLPADGSSRVGATRAKRENNQS